MEMTALLGKLFNVRSGEWRRLGLLYSMSLVALTGMLWADTILQAAFLQRVGVQYLPWLLVSSAVCSIGAMVIYSAFADRVSNTRLLIAILAIGGAGVLLGLGVLAAGLTMLGFLILYLVLNVPLLDVYNVHWATYVNSFYDIRTAKRIIPVQSTAARVAGIISGLSMPLMNRLFSPPAIMALTIVNLAIMGILAAAMPRILREQRADRAGGAGHLTMTQPAPERTHAKGVAGSYGVSLREGYQQVLRSPFLRWMAASTLLMTILMPLLNYGASAILQSELKTTVAISNFTGLLSGVANLVILPFQLLLLSRLIARLGLGNASLIYPVTSLVAVGGLAVAPSLGTGALAFLDRTALRTAFRLPTDNLLYNAVPQRVKARTRAFVGGLIIPIGAIAGSLLLLTPLMWAPWFLPAASLLTAVAFTVAVLMVRRQYGKALVDLLEQEDYSSLALQAPSEQGEPSALSSDSATLARLAQKLSDSLEEETNPERTIFLAQLVMAVGGEASVPVVGQAARDTPNSRLRASLVDVLVTADVRGAGARNLYVDLLSDPDPQVRLSAVAGLEQIDGPRDPRYLEIAGRLLADPDLDVRLRVLPALLASGDPGHHAPAGAELRSLLKSPAPHTRARAVRIVGEVRVFAFMLELVRSLTDPEDEVRLSAGLATEALAGAEVMAGKRDMLLALALLLLHDPVERARVSAVTVLSRLSEDRGASASAARESSVAGLTDPSSDVRRRAVETLVRASRRAIPQVQEQLNAADPHQRKMAAVVLARIEPRKYGSLVLGSGLEDNLLAVYRNLACLQALAGCPGPAVDLLNSALGEQNACLIEEIFYLLTAIQDPAAVQTIQRSLRSPQSEVRANAVEALESLTAPRTAALVGPLLEPNQPAGPSLTLAKQTWEIAISTPAAALSLLLGDASDTWRRALAAAALVEFSASDEPQPQAEVGKLLELARTDPDETVRAEARATAGSRDGRALSLVRKVVTLKDVPFFSSMPTEQLRVLAGVCEEEAFLAGAPLFGQGDCGGVLYIVAAGRVSIEQEKRKGSFARIATVEAGSYLGESEFFDGNCRTNSAVAIQDTVTLKLRREPLIALARQQPELSLELINMLSNRLREANERIAELTRTEPQSLQKLYDQFESDI